jgi:hypothetical protein
MTNRYERSARAASALVLIVAVALTLSGCGGGGNSKLAEKTLTFTERDTNFFSFFDNIPKTKVGPDGPEKLSNGDQLTFASDLLDASKRDVGDLDVTCVFTRPGRMDDSSAVCTGVMTIPGGSLTASVGGTAFAQGAQEGAKTKGAILGGTGEYAGATGDFESTNEPSRDTIHVFLPKQ